LRFSKTAELATLRNCFKPAFDQETIGAAQRGIVSGRSGRFADTVAIAGVNRGSHRAPHIFALFLEKSDMVRRPGGAKIVICRNREQR
jgi:hypothetical protein